MTKRMSITTLGLTRWLHHNETGSAVKDNDEQS